MRLALFSCALLLAACSAPEPVGLTGPRVGDGPEGEGTDAWDGTDVNADTDSEVGPDTTSVATGQGCGSGVAGLHYTLSMTHNGATRTALVDLPAGYDGSQALPVVLNFHGNAMDSGLQRTYTGMDEAANDRGWISVHPNGQNRTWNVLPFSTDVDWADALIDELEHTLCVDNSRIYSTGMSQGGNLSYLIACELGDRVAAVAPVAGSDVSVLCSGAHHVPVFHIHGDADNVVDFGGGYLYPGAVESVSDWASRVNECDAAPVLTHTVGAVTCETRSCEPTSEATLCTVAGGGHTWPGAAPIPLLNETNTDIDATQEVLDFFEGYSL